MEVRVQISAAAQAALLNDLVDIDAWIQAAVAGKIASCTKRMQQAWTQKLMADPTFTDPIPSNSDDFVALVLAQPDYLNRADTDAKEKADALARAEADALAKAEADALAKAAL